MKRYQVYGRQGWLFQSDQEQEAVLVCRIECLTNRQRPYVVDAVTGEVVYQAIHA